MAARVWTAQDNTGQWWVHGRITPSGALRATDKREAEFIVSAIETAYEAGRQDALQALRDVLDVPKRLEGQD